ncbi:MAG: 1-(5-phosphoribosyl)-5-[(5-phosphoribosylamino)methylideneamino]imidazole-4-carboxamide isomerase [Actinomycetota bacterium]
MIVIPAIDLRGGRVVRLVRGRPEEETGYSDDPAATAAAFVEEGARWLHVVDLDAALDEGDNRASLRRIVAQGVDVQAGGGIRSHDEIDDLIDEGVARVVLSTAPILDPGFLRGAVDRHGDRIAVALDVEGDEVRIRGWTEGAGPVGETLGALQTAGAPRFLVTQISRDGTLEGPDQDLYRRLVERTDRPVMASGGVRDASDLRALAGTGVEAAIVGRALYEGTLSLADALEASG